MDKTIQTLLDLLKITYFKKEIDVVIDDPKKLYQVAKDNGVSGTIYNTIKHIITDETVLNRFKKDFFKYVSDDARKLSLIRKLSKIFNQNNINYINYIFLKGAHLKQLYPESYMRSMGDIDVLVREDDMSAVKEKLLENGFKLNHMGPVHDIYSYGDLEVEIHRSLMIDEAPYDCSSIKEVWLTAYKGVDNQYRMTAEVELVFLLLHIRKHLLSDGVGLRTILDIGIYLEYYKKEIDFIKLNTLLQETKVETLFDNLFLFNEKYLDFDLSNLHKVASAFDEILYMTFTEYIIKSGVHGLGMNFNTFASRFAGDENNNLSRNQSILRMVFPTFNMMKYRYPKMMKYKVFLPLAWIRRGISVLFKHPRRILTYFRLIKRVDNEEVEHASEILKKMGI